MLNQIYHLNQKNWYNDVFIRINKIIDYFRQIVHMSSVEDTPYRSYNRTWEEIEKMLEEAQKRLVQWKDWYEQCRKTGDLDGMKESARSHKALQGVVKTLKWTLGEEGIDTPLE